MVARLWVAILFINYLENVEAANILCVFQVPVKSHQIAFRPLTEELLRNNYKIDVLTVDPNYSVGQTPMNVTEIDIHNISYSSWRVETVNKSVISQVTAVIRALIDLSVVQFASEELQNFIKNKKPYDLIIADSMSLSTPVFAHIFKAPLLIISTASILPMTFSYVGIPNHVLFYPGFFCQSIYTSTLYKKYDAIYNDFIYHNLGKEYEQNLHEVLSSTIFPDLPPVKLFSELKNYVDLYLVNMYPVWEGIRPYPLNSILFKIAPLEQDIPKEIESFLELSKNGVIYVSYGTSVLFSKLAENIISQILKGLSRVPFEVLLKCDTDELPGRPPNVKLFKFLPQANILKHPKIKLLITHGGQHSVDEAIEAGVPMIVTPIRYDQYANSERCVHFGIGITFDLKTISEQNIVDGVATIVEDERYRKNIIKLRSIVQDTPINPMDKFMWAVEYVIRHKGASHLRSPSANLCWAEFFELELLFYVSCFIIITLLIILKLLMAVFIIVLSAKIYRGTKK